MTDVYHFTHLDNLESVLKCGLLCDSATTAQQLLECEAGDPSIKEERRRREVLVPPGGVVADYVPFYFGPRSPMLYKITQGGVPSFTGDPHDLVYLCTTIERLRGAGATLVLTDRNAAKAVAEFSRDPGRWFETGFIDWELMNQTMWNDVPQYRDRMERRMAECLAHEHVPPDAFLTVAVHDESRRATVEAMLEAHADPPTIVVRPGWYY